MKAVIITVGIQFLLKGLNGFNFLQVSGHRSFQFLITPTLKVRPPFVTFLKMGH